MYLHERASCSARDRTRRARSCDRARSSGSVVGSLSSIWIRCRRSPGGRAHRRRRVNARIRKSLSRAVGIGAIQPIEERRNLEQPRAVLDEVLVDQLVAVSGDERACHGGLRLRWSGRFLRASACRRARSRAFSTHLDTPDHSVPVDLVHVERLADALEQHDGQPSAQVLAGTRSSPRSTQSGCSGVIEVRDSSERRRSNTATPSASRSRDPPPVGFRQKTREVA